MKPSDLIKPYLPITAAPEDRRRILVYTEGEQTEVNYLRQFMLLHRIPTDRISIQHPSHSDPAGILKAAIAELAWQDYLGGRGERHFAEVWCVFDRDQHPHFEETLELSRAYPRIHVIPSAPSIELWFLHHFSARRKPYPIIKTQIGEPEIKSTRSNNILTETQITRYKVSPHPQEQCFNELKGHMASYSKKCPDVARQLEKRLANASAIDYPISLQDEHECWTLIPELLRRMLAICYSEAEIEARLPSGSASVPPAAKSAADTLLEPLLPRLREQRAGGISSAAIHEALTREGIAVPLSTLRRWLTRNIPLRQKRSKAEAEAA